MKLDQFWPLLHQLPWKTNLKVYTKKGSTKSAELTTVSYGRGQNWFAKKCTLPAQKKSQTCWSHV